MSNNVSEEITRQQPISQTQSISENLSVVLGGASLVFLGVIVSRGLEIVTRSLIARYLGPNSFGIFSTGYSFLSILGTIILVGLPLGIVRFVAQYNETESNSKYAFISVAFWFVLTVGIITGVLLWGLSDSIAQIFFRDTQMIPVIRIIGISLPLFGVLTIISSIFQAEKSVRSHVLVNSFALPIVRLLLAGFSVHFGLSVYGVIALYFIVAIGAALLLAFLLFRSHLAKLFEKVRNLNKIIWTLMHFSIPLMLGALLSTGVWQLDILLLQSLKGFNETGIYSVALTLGRVPNMILLAFSFMTAPFMARLYRENQLDAMRTLYGQTADMIFVVVLPIAVFFLCFAPLIIEIIYGEPYSQTVHVFRIITAGYFFHSILGPNGNTLIMLGRSRLFLIDTILMALISVFLYLVLIPVMCSTGAAIATIAGLLLINILFTVQLYRAVQINSLKRIRYKLLVPLSLAGMLAFVTEGLEVKLAPWLQLGVISIVFFTTYGGLTIWFGFVKLAEIKKLKQVLLQRRHIE